MRCTSVILCCLLCSYFHFVHPVCTSMFVRSEWLFHVLHIQSLVKDNDNARKISLTRISRKEYQNEKVHTRFFIPGRFVLDLIPLTASLPRLFPSYILLTRVTHLKSLLKIDSFIPTYYGQLVYYTISFKFSLWIHTCFYV